MTGPCRECALEAELIEGVCVECIFRMADQGSKISKEDLRRVRDEVEKETSGLIPPNILRSILKGAVDRIETNHRTGRLGQDEDILDHAVNEIQRLGGLGMCREMMRMAESFRSMAHEVGRGLEETAQTVEDEVRRKVRILSSLPRGTPS